MSLRLRRVLAHVFCPNVVCFPICQDDRTIAFHKQLKQMQEIVLCWKWFWRCQMFFDGSDFKQRDLIIKVILYAMLHALHALEIFSRFSHCTRDMAEESHTRVVLIALDKSKQAEYAFNCKCPQHTFVTFFVGIHVHAMCVCVCMCVCVFKYSTCLIFCGSVGRSDVDTLIFGQDFNYLQLYAPESMRKLGHSCLQN